jgi:hypothetical protein
LLHLLVWILLFRVVAEYRFVHERVEELLLPAVIAGTGGLHWAALLVLADEIAGLPLFADLKRAVGEEVGFAAEVLPVMRVDALGFVVLCVEGTPFGFEVKYVELLIARHLVHERRFDVLIRVRKGAELLVVTLGRRLRAEFGFVLLNVV